MVTFGLALREAREASGKTLRETAEVAGIGVPQLSSIERDLKTPLTDDKVERVAQYLGADSRRLLELAQNSRRRVRTPQDPRRNAIAQALLRKVNTLDDEELGKLETELRTRGLLRGSRAADVWG